MDVTETEYKGHVIRSAVIGGKPNAHVYREGIKGPRFKTSAKTMEQAMDEARAWVDGFDEDRAEGRTEESGVAVGSQADFEYALGVVSMSDPQKAMLLAHYNAPERIVTAADLTAAAGYKDQNRAGRMYGQLGRDIAEITGLEAPVEGEGDDVVWIGVLAHDTGEPSEEGEVRWQMHDALADAIAELNLR